MISSPNKHMEHLEDNVINNGVVGARDSIKFLQSLRNMLSGDSTQAVNTTVKWDGAPAVIVGRKEGKLFVATKSYFSKDSKYYQSVSDINKADIPEDLKYKLNACLYYLKDLKCDKVIQGDLLFTNKDLHAVFTHVHMMPRAHADARNGHDGRVRNGTSRTMYGDGTRFRFARVT